MTRIPIMPLAFSRLLAGVECVERFERDGVRFSVATVYPLECVYCGRGLGMMDSCDCDDARAHRIEQTVKAFGVPRALMGSKP